SPAKLQIAWDGTTLALSTVSSHLRFGVWYLDVDEKSRLWDRLSNEICLQAWLRRGLFSSFILRDASGLGTVITFGGNEYSALYLYKKPLDEFGATSSIFADFCAPSIPAYDTLSEIEAAKLWDGRLS
ncbi:hypothetical protein FOZ63_021091, partial [Perkinsus olseni]